MIRLAAIAIALFGFVSAATAQIKVEQARLFDIAIYVTDLERSEAFYSQVYDQRR